MRQETRKKQNSYKSLRNSLNAYESKNQRKPKKNAAKQNDDKTNSRKESTIYQVIGKVHTECDFICYVFIAFDVGN